MKRAKLGRVPWYSTVICSDLSSSSNEPILSVYNQYEGLEDDKKMVVSKIWLDGGANQADIVVPKILTPDEISAMISNYIDSLGTLVFWKGATEEDKS